MTLSCWVQCFFLIKNTGRLNGCYSIAAPFLQHGIRPWQVFKYKDTYNFSAAIKKKETKEGHTLDLHIHCEFEIIGMICICYK